MKKKAPLTKEGLTTYFDQMATDGKVETTVEWLVDMALLIQSDVEARHAAALRQQEWVAIEDGSLRISGTQTLVSFNEIAKQFYEGQSVDSLADRYGESFEAIENIIRSYRRCPELYRIARRGLIEIKEWNGNDYCMREIAEETIDSLDEFASTGTIEF